MDLPFQHSEAKGFISSAELSMKQTAAPGPENRSRFQKVSLVSRRLEHTAGGGGRDGSPSRVSLLLQAWEREIVEKTASGPSAVTQRSCSSSVSILKDFAAHGPIFSQVFSPRRREEKREDDTVPAPRDVPVHRESYMHGVLLPTVPRCQRSTRDPKPKARHVTVLREGREAEEGRKTQNGMCKATTVPSLHQRGCKPDGGGITKITARGKSSLSAVDTRESSREKCSKPDESMPNATPRGRDKLQDLQTSTTSAQCPLTDWSGAGEGGAVHREGSISAIQPRTESYDEAGSTSKNISKKASNGPELLCGARASPKDSEVEMKEGEMMKNHKGVAQDTQSIPEPPMESTAKPQPESIPKPQPEGVSKPQPEGVSKPQPEGVSKPQPESVPKLQSEGVPKPQPENVPKPQPESAPKLQSEGVPKLKSEGVPKPQDESTPKPQPESIPKPQADSVLKCQLDSVRKSQPEGVPKPQPESVPKPQPESAPKPQSEGVPKLKSEGVPKPQDESIPKLQPEGVPKPLPESTPKPQPESVPKPQSESISKPQIESIPEPPHESPAPPQSLPDASEEDPELVVDMEIFVDTLRNMEPSEIRKAPKVPRQPRPSALGRCPALPPIHEDHVAPRTHISLPVALQELLAWGGGGQRAETPPEDTENHDEEEEIENPYLSPGEKALRRAQNGNGELGSLLGGPTQGRATGERSILFRGNVLKGMALLSDFLEHHAASIILFSEAGFAGQRREIWGDVPDATSWELSHKISIRVIRGGWVMYEKPRFHGRKCVLAEGDVEIDNPWIVALPDSATIHSVLSPHQDYRTPEISLFAEENGEGARLQFSDSAEDTRVQGQSLTASSIIVHSGLWLVYSKPFFDDDPYVLEPGGYPSLKAWGAKDPSICSMHPIRLGCPVVERPGEPQVLIYEDTGFQGHSFIVSRDIYDLKRLPELPLPTVGSMRVLGGCWVGYEKEGFRGHQYLLEEGEYQDWRQWGGYSKELMSLRLIRTDFSDPALVLFEAMDFEEGPSVELSEALPDTQLAGYGTVTQSIHVLSGVWVAYEGPNFSGEQYILEKGVYRNFEDWGATNCRIASAQPILQVREHNLHFVSKILLFSEPDFLGEHLAFEDEQSALPDSFVPRSCRVHGGSWILFDSQAFTGEQHVLSEGEYPTLGAMGCLSSTTIRSLKKVPVFFSEPSIFLHGLECFEGKEIELNNEVRSLQAEGFNNHVLSVRVKGGIWVLCEHGDFRGRQWLLECTEITNWLTYSGLQHVGSLYPIRQRRIYFRIRSKELQLYLSVPDDVEDMKAGRVVVSSLSEQSSSVWYYEDGLLKNQVAPAMSLQVIGPAGKGAKAVLWSETRMPRQTWSINSQGQIHSQMFEDMILDVKGGRSYDRDHAIIWEVAEERPTQIWEIQVL
uniref:Crystallin beta-gamma domain containing 2 n=1 Tax=Phasianus colchicus TaxID=9054 RepID=A0A669Q2R1_PHACC